ncbi:alpha/beta hydrolase [Muricoccus aerilatus]|uniref:alpha/beta hydrolase n=1 Tax=Muricoccus aerilatus TaxID=452982 RepID=UPI0005C1EEC4|nr:alpha/beta hydrolase [Roseomonas aerilata]
MPNAELDEVRRMLTSSPRPAGLAERRQRLDGLGARYTVPQDVHVEPEDAGGVAAEWTQTPLADPARVILFLHGGGYVSGSVASHRHMIAQAGREAGARTLALGYRLAPEHPFPAALDDVLAAYRWLLVQGIAPGNIVIAGESAGGGLALATLVSLRDAGDPLPGRVWCSSPWVDLSMTGETMETKAAQDPLISKAYLKELAGLYLHGQDPCGPCTSPLYADLRGLPPMLIQVGSAETLLADSLRLAAVAGAADVRVTLQVWPHMIHAWHLFYQQLAPGRRSLAEFGAFARAELPGS